MSDFNMPPVVYLDPEDEADEVLAIWVRGTYKWGDDKGVKKVLVGRHYKGDAPRGFAGVMPDRIERLTNERHVLVYRRLLGDGHVSHVSAEMPPQPLAGGVDFLPRVAT